MVRCDRAARAGVGEGNLLYTSTSAKARHRCRHVCTIKNIRKSLVLVRLRVEFVKLPAVPAGLGPAIYPTGRSAH